MIRSKLETETLNYWQACQWLFNKRSTKQQKQLALRKLKQQSNHSELGYLSILANISLEEYDARQDQFSLWKGTKS